jgi:hypothetical protein
VEQNRLDSQPRTFHTFCSIGSLDFDGTVKTEDCTSLDGRATEDGTFPVHDQAEVPREIIVEVQSKSGSVAVVVTQHSAESLAALGLTHCLANFVARFDHPVVEPLMVSFRVKVVEKSTQSVPQDSVARSSGARRFRQNWWNSWSAWPGKTQLVALV